MAWGPGTSRARRELASALWLVGSCVLHSVFVSLSSSQRAHLPSSCESLGAGYLACPRFNRMLTLCKGISRDRAAASENESWSGFVPNFIVYTNPKSTFRFRRRRRCKKKETSSKRQSFSSSVLCYSVCVCVCWGGWGGGGNPNVPEAGITTWAIFQCFSLCRGGKKENAGQGIDCVGKCHVVFFSSPFFGDSHQELGDGGHGCLVRFSLSLSLSCRGLARALRGDAGRVRVCTSSGLPFPSREGGEDLRTTRFLLDFPR